MYTYVNGGCYRLTTTTQSWFGSVAACEQPQAGAFLASFDSESEFSWVYQYFALSGQNVWIGLNNIERAGLFQWTDGSNATFQYWAANQPASATLDQRCVQVGSTQSNGQWNLASCATSYKAICKYDPTVVQQENGTTMCIVKISAKLY